MTLDSEKKELTENDISEKVKEFVVHNGGMLENSYNEFLSSKEIQYLQKPEEELDFHLRGCKILFLTANEIETGILHKHLVGQGQIIKIGKGVVTFYIAKWGKYKIAHVWAGQTGSHTFQGTMKTVRRVLKDFRPKVIMGIGVAFGIDLKSQKIGDVLISEAIYPYDKGIKLVNGKIKIKNDHMMKTNAWLFERLRQKRDLDLDIISNANKFANKVHIGNMLTGEAVLSDQDVKNIILSAFPNKEFVGGEMESFGLYDESNEAEIPCVVIKSICDWGSAKNSLSDLDDEDERKKESNKRKDSCQAFAMENTCKLCDRIVNDEYIFDGNPQITGLNVEQKKNKF